MGGRGVSLKTESGPLGCGKMVLYIWLSVWQELDRNWVTEKWSGLSCTKLAIRWKCCDSLDLAPRCIVFLMLFHGTVFSVSADVYSVAILRKETSRHMAIIYSWYPEEAELKELSSRYALAISHMALHCQGLKDMRVTQNPESTSS